MKCDDHHGSPCPNIDQILAQPNPSLCKMSDTQILSYLDKCVIHWRRRRDEAHNEKARTLANHYIDAFQSVRVSIFGDALPTDEKDCLDPALRENDRECRIESLETEAKTLKRELCQANERANMYEIQAKRLAVMCAPSIWIEEDRRKIGKLQAEIDRLNGRYERVLGAAWHLHLTGLRYSLIDFKDECERLGLSELGLTAFSYNDLPRTTRERL